MSSQSTSSVSSAELHAKSEGPRIVFMGTPDFAVPSLKALVDNGLKPVGVVTGPDKKRGRGQIVSPTAVKKAALEANIATILQPEDVRDPQFAKEIEALKPDIMVVVAFRILPVGVFSLSKLGTFNLHGSLLPRYRGAAPINRAIMAGDTETGVTTFLLQEKVDTGNMLLKRSMPIGPNETAGEVHDRMMVIGAQAVVDTVHLLLKGEAALEAQNDAQATPAPKIFKEDCEIHWDHLAMDIHNQIRALSPYPGAFTLLEGKRFKIWESRVVEENKVCGAPGEIVDSETNLVIAAQKGCIQLLRVQQEGKNAMDGSDFLRGNPIPTGITLG